MKTFARLSVLLAFLLLLLPTEIPAQESQFGFMFTKDPLNPVFRGGGAGTWDLTVLAPWVLFNSDGGCYEMWYTGLLNGRANGIGFAVSDDGYIWERKSPLPVLSPTPGSWDSLSVVGASVIRERMGCTRCGTRVESSTCPTGFPHFIGYAVSNNGIDWIKSAGPVLGPGTQPWEATSVAYCCVIPSEGGYTMLDTGANVQQCPHRARLLRRRQFLDPRHHQQSRTDRGALRGPGTGMHICLRVVTDGQLMYIFYTAERVPALRDTRDRGRKVGRWWGNREKDLLNPILGPGASGSWDMNGVELGAIMFEGGQARMWFDGERYLPTFSASLGYAAGPWPMSPLPTVPFGISPVNGSGNVVPPAVALVWSQCVPGVLQYRVEVAADSVFQIVLLDSLVSDTTWYLIEPGDFAVVLVARQGKE